MTAKHSGRIEASSTGDKAHVHWGGGKAFHADPRRCGEKLQKRFRAVDRYRLAPLRACAFARENADDAHRCARHIQFKPLRASARVALRAPDSATLSDRW